MYDERDYVRRPVIKKEEGKTGTKTNQNKTGGFRILGKYRIMTELGGIFYVVKCSDDKWRMQKGVNFMDIMSVKTKEKSSRTIDISEMKTIKDFFMKKIVYIDRFDQFYSPLKIKSTDIITYVGPNEA